MPTEEEKQKVFSSIEISQESLMKQGIASERMHQDMLDRVHQLDKKYPDVTVNQVQDAFYYEAPNNEVASRLVEDFKSIFAASP